jgi:antitoxin VapB
MAVPKKSTKTAKLILRGGCQYVILPKEFEFKGKGVRVRKQGDAVVLEPLVTSAKEWFAAIDRHPAADAFRGDWRSQPIAPKRKVFE